MTGKVAAAQERARKARTEFTSTLEELTHRVAPQTLAHEAMAALRTRGERAAEVAVTTANNNPAAAAGVVGALGLFLARRRIWRWVRGRRTATETS